MSESTPKILFLDSLQRCAEVEGFIPSFYDRFLSANDEIRQKFRHTDFEQQNHMLLRSLTLAAGATVGEAKSLRELKERAETHDRHHLNIEPRLYEIWRSNIIKTASEFDDQWNEDIENAWQDILGYVVNYMIKHY